MSSFEMLKGFATPDGTRKYMEDAVAAGKPREHFKEFDGLCLSSIGMGTYLGDLTQKDDEAVENAVYSSIKSGTVNVIDTAINYRAMKSEKSIGKALMRLENEGITRDRVFISTKNGYITNDGDFPGVDVMEYMYRMYISTGVIATDDISSGYNVMHSAYLAKCIDKSLANMHLSTIDLVYIHNAFESWHGDVSKAKFMEMLAGAFQVYEQYRKQGKLRYYGMATWTCFRVPVESNEYLSLHDVVRVAESVGGKDHGLRFIQLPYNLAYSEALLLNNQKVGSDNLTLLEAAAKLGIGVFTSIPLFQGRLLTAPIPDYPGAKDRISKLLQLVRSSPAVIAPLVGQKKPEHVQENLRVADVPPLTRDQFEQAVKMLMERPESG